MQRTQTPNAGAAASPAASAPNSQLIPTKTYTKAEIAATERLKKYVGYVAIGPDGMSFDWLKTFDATEFDADRTLDKERKILTDQERPYLEVAKVLHKNYLLMLSKVLMGYIEIQQEAAASWFPNAFKWFLSQSELSHQTKLNTLVWKLPVSDEKQCARWRNRWAGFLNHLQIIKIIGCPINAAVLTVFTSSNLAQTSATDMKEEKNKGVVELVIQDTTIEMSALEGQPNPLKRMLAQFPNLQRLSFNNIKFPAGMDGMIARETFLKMITARVPKFTHLTFTNCGFSDADLEIFRPYLKGNTHLKSLDLVVNSFTSAARDQLVGELRDHNITLEFVDLNSRQAQLIMYDNPLQIVLCRNKAKARLENEWRKAEQTLKKANVMLRDEKDQTSQRLLEHHLPLLEGCVISRELKAVQYPLDAKVSNDLAQQYFETLFAFYKKWLALARSPNSASIICYEKAIEILELLLYSDKPVPRLKDDMGPDRLLQEGHRHECGGDCDHSPNYSLGTGEQQWRMVRDLSAARSELWKMQTAVAAASSPAATGVVPSTTAPQNNKG